MGLCVSGSIPVGSGTRRILGSTFWTKETRGNNLEYCCRRRWSTLRMGDGTDQDQGAFFWPKSSSVTEETRNTESLAHFWIHNRWNSEKQLEQLHTWSGDGRGRNNQTRSSLYCTCTVRFKKWISGRSLGFVELLFHIYCRVKYFKIAWSFEKKRDFFSAQISSLRKVSSF